MQLVLPEVRRPPGPPFTVHTEVFDGPLDLLLYLVRRDGISLSRVSLSAIADSYLEFLDRMRELDLSIAADWLLMAATLIHLKALDLLPRPSALLEPDEPDPRDQLLSQLEAYERVKAEAQALEARPQVGRDTWTRPAAPDLPPAFGPENAFELLDLLHAMLVREAEPDPVVRLGEGGPDVGGCCRRVLAALGGLGGRGDLVAMLTSLTTRAERVVTFIVVLEMTRLGWLSLAQREHLGAVEVTQAVADADIDLAQIAGRMIPAEEGGQLGLELRRSPA